MDAAAHVDIRITQRFDAPADHVFNAWLDPRFAGRWLFATATRPVPRVKIDARAGGSFRFEDRRYGKAVVQAGRYLEIARPRRIAFTLSGSRKPARNGAAHVSIEIAPIGKGCELTLLHQRVRPDEADRIEGRWAGMLYGLATMLDKTKNA
jgi:uncharacterized protein YndB with AHSA1/START domain